MVDTVLQFEGDRHYAYRILRTLKTGLAAALKLEFMKWLKQE
jgi:DNA repair protein RadA/Sms